jgi:outer membrane protein assembly factor BamB
MTPRRATGWRDLPRFVVTLVLLLALAALGPAGAQAPLTFVQMSDPHLPAMGSAAATARAFAEIRALDPAPAFVVITGDITDIGATSEFERLVSIAGTSGLPVYPLFGNHDVRSALASRADALALFNPLTLGTLPSLTRYFAFARGDFHFFVLDSSLPFEHLGAFDPEQVRWLAGELAALPDDAFPVLFTHFWPFSPDGDFPPGGQEIMALLDRFRGALIVCGHGHSIRLWKDGNVSLVMTPSVYGKTGGYRVLTLSPDRVVSRLRSWQEPALGPEQTVWEAGPPAAALRLLAPAEGAEARGPLTVVVQTTPAGLSDLTYRIDRGSWKPLPKGPELTTVPTAGLAPGKHELTVRLRAPGAGARFARAHFTIPAAAVALAWEVNVGAPVQRAPVIVGESVIVAAWNGVQALRVTDGTTLWRRPAEEEILGGAASDGERVIYGDGRRLVACNASTGEPLWMYSVAEPIKATPLIAGGRVWVGVGSMMLALDAETGEGIWSYPAKGMIQAAPALMDGTLYFAAWDNTVRALNAATGAVRWERPVGQPATYPPYSPGAGTPAVSGGQVVFCAPWSRLTEGAQAFTVAAGAPTWSFAATCGYSSPAVHGDRVYLTTRAGAVVALDAKGAQIWQRSIGQAIYDSSATVAGDLLLVAGLRGMVTGLDLRTGAVRWRHQVGDGYVLAGVAAHPGRAIVAQIDGAVSAITW